VLKTSFAHPPEISYIRDPMVKNFTPAAALLLLKDGTVFTGKSLGKIGTATGEICFNTGMTGYQEIFTDPSYSGQMIVMTNNHLGNYGTINTEIESGSVKIAGMICRNYSGQNFSRLPAEESLQDYFEKNGIVGISDIDTRALVVHIREAGAMNCIISSETNDIEALKKILDQAPDMDGLDLAKEVSTKEVYYAGEASAPIKVAVLDCGIKHNILKCLVDRGVYAKVFPATTPASELLAWNPNGVFISNGPGDPAAMPYAVETVRQIQEAGKPLFGICLGHQLLALANGIPTFKMHHGHRGINHPVKNLITGKSEITSQNHGFEVSREAIEKSETVEVTHVNLNDNTIEGIRIKDKKSFSVQYHPESSPGPHDSRYLFDDFIALMN
jgi:carbamoyl-phosphate synthase small subunit